MLISPKHELFADYRRAYLAKDERKLEEIRRRADKRVEIDQIDRWKAWMEKNNEKVGLFKFIHQQTCANFGGRRLYDYP